MAPTDTRRRPDQRLMETGDFDKANTVKMALEEKQVSDDGVFVIACLCNFSPVMSYGGVVPQGPSSQLLLSHYSKYSGLL